MILNKNFRWADDRTNRLPIHISEMAIRLALSDVNRNPYARISLIPSSRISSFEEYKMRHLLWRREQRARWHWSRSLDEMVKFAHHFYEAYPNLDLFLDFNHWD